MENKNNLTDSVAESKEVAKDSYSVYQYFEKHPTFLVTCVSSLVAVASYCIKMASNSYCEKYYSYWNIDINLINMDDNVGYIVLQAFVFVFSLITIHAILGSTADTYMKQKQKIGLLRKEQRELKKTLNKSCGKGANNAKKTRLKEKRKKDIKQEAFDIENLTNQYQKLKENIGKCRSRNVRNLIAVMLVSVFIGTVSILFLAKEDSVAFWIASSIVSCGIVLVWWICYFFFARCCSQNTNKEESESDNHQLTETDQNGRFLFEVVATDGLKSFVSNQAIKTVLSVVLIALFAICFSVRSLAMSAAEVKTCYSVYTDQAGTYAVVYSSKDTIVLEEITICGNKATIDASKQRIISSDDISFVIRYFDQVRVEKNGD